MRRAALALVVLAAIAAAVVAAGCGKRKSVTAPNLPPETTVFLRGGVDATNHRVHIYWFGSDPDGDVVAYQMRFAPSGGNPDPSWGTVYCALPGRCTDSLFTVPTGDSALIHTQFEIRSVDNQGAVDPTPAIQPFQLSNLAPKVHITNPLRRARAAGQPEDTSFASVTINWEVDDPDGGGPGLRYHVWLDGRYDAYDSTTANTFTVESSRFLNAAGTYVSGYRTLYLQAVDDGGRFGPIDSTSWYVRAPATVLDPTTKRGRLLVIDDSNSLTNSNFAVDTLYANVVARSTQADPYREGLSRYVTLAPGTFSFMRLQYSNPFRSARDLMQTFRQFDAVVWYRGYEDQLAHASGLPGQRRAIHPVGRKALSRGAVPDRGKQFVWQPAAGLHHPLSQLPPFLPDVRRWNRRFHRRDRNRDPGVPALGHVCGHHHAPGSAGHGAGRTPRAARLRGQRHEPGRGLGPWRHPEPGRSQRHAVRDDRQSVPGSGDRGELPGPRAGFATPHSQLEEIAVALLSGALPPAVRPHQRPARALDCLEPLPDPGKRKLLAGKPFDPRCHPATAFRLR